MTRVAGYPPTRDHWLETGRTGPNLTYRIMFLTGVDFDAYPELRRASLESFGVLEAAVREFQLSAPLDHEKDLAFAA